MRRLFLFAFALLLLTGCSSTLETGYEPKPLNMSSARRETLYTDPYSQSAMEKQQDENSDESAVHRPGNP